MTPWWIAVPVRPTGYQDGDSPVGGQLSNTTDIDYGAGRYAAVSRLGWA